MEASRKDTERSQAAVRLVLGLLGTLYSPCLALAGVLPAGRMLVLVAIGAVFLAIAALLRWAIIRRPGRYPGRRVFAMMLDYSTLGLSMILGGEALLPVYALVLWVTVGYGIRYGSRYLAMSTGMAVLVLALVAGFTAYWQAHPYLASTLVLTTLIVPAYMHVLLRRNRQAHEREREATLAKTRFLAQASHDLRQPIHSIALFTDCLRDGQLDAHQRQLVDNIDRSLHGVSHLFHSILDSYTLDSGKLRARPETVAVKALLESVAHHSRDAARWADTSIRVRAGDDLIHTDPHLLSTIIQNLVSNAVKYGEGRGVLVAARRRGGRLSLQVHDRGRGIPGQSLGQVFDEFYRVRQPRDKDIDGLGLGLSIVKRLCALLGAQVSIRSTPGRGTVVTVEGFEPVDRRPPARPRPTGRQASPLHGLRVLLIEDDADVLMATGLLLERWGCIVQRAATLPDRPVACDVVISDYALNAEVTGAECIMRLRQMQGRPLPALLLTGHDAKSIRDLVADVNLPILAKPVRPAELRSLLTALALDAGRAGGLPQAQLPQAG